MMIQKRGFTLVELLVVIAIIGLLATFAVVQLSGARDKARIAKGMAQSGQVLRSIGDDAIGRWDFDECSGTIAADSSGLGNNGAITNASWSTNSASNQGCSLSFNGTSAYVDAGNASSMNLPAGGSVTMCAWVNFSGAGGARSIVSKRDDALGTPYAYGMTILGNTFYVYTSGASAVQIFSYAAPTNKWIYVCGVISSAPTVLYVDGSVFGKLGPGGGIASNTAHFKIGRSSDTGVNTEYFSGLIDDVRVYARSLSAENIHQMYVEGLPRHLAER